MENKKSVPQQQLQIDYPSNPFVGLEEWYGCRTIHLDEAVEKLVEKKVAEALKQKRDGNEDADERVIIIKQISETDAETEILDYIKAHPDSYPSDISEQLRIDIELVFKIIGSLKTKGVIE